ncbi:TatD family hydrolase [Lentisphaerota bacterium WC36G]|nr:TatD family hydrolase [Lentisphaerae bacterium WC36]
MLINFHTHSQYSTPTNSEILKIYSYDFYEITRAKENLFNIPVTIGIHPWYISGDFEFQLKQFIDFVNKTMNNNNFLAIGECGLDRSSHAIMPFEIQTIVFAEQLKLANKINKPIIVHCIKSYPEVIKLRKDLNLQHLTMIFHNYNANEQITNELLKNKNNYFSFGIQLLENKKLQSLLKKIPLNQIFFETDNIDDDIKLAQLYQFAVNELKVADNVRTLSYIIEDNFTHIFKIGIDSINNG